MRKPKMILFDYGQTLANQKQFDGVAGTKAVMQYATKNKYNHTAEDVMAVVDAINMEIADATLPYYKTRWYHPLYIGLPG